MADRTPDSSAEYRGRLELTWTNKDQALLWSEDGSYRWVPPTDYRVAEVRLLHDAGSVGTVGPDSRRAADNLLIRGDALNALTSLARLSEFQTEYLGKVKLAYLDPPFNTQQAFEQYDDALEHSVWLTMMRDRLVQIRRLLSATGSVWVHCDDAEQHRIRGVLDEVYGAANFIGTIIWLKSDSPRSSSKFFSTDQDYIHVYARDSEVWRPKKLPRTEAVNAKYQNPDNDPRGPWFGDNLRANKPYSIGRYTVDGPTGRSFTPPPGKFWRISFETFTNLREDGRIWWGRDGDAFPTVKRFLSDVSDLVPRTAWGHEEVGSNRTSNSEIKRLFPGSTPFATPKPERLMQRIIEIGSEPGDVVLDCFLGSGTTTAVAHKMGRRWVGVERSADTISTYALPRLEKVVEGDDPGGITDAVSWHGGGAFRILDVSPSMFAVSGGYIVLADWAINGNLAEATAAQLGYEYRLDPPFCGVKGRSLLAVVDGLVTVDVLDLIASRLEETERAVICGTAIAEDADAALKAISPGSRVRRIPASILADYRQTGRRFFRPRDVRPQESLTKSNGSTEATAVTETSST